MTDLRAFLAGVVCGSLAVVTLEMLVLGVRLVVLASRALR